MPFAGSIVAIVPPVAGDGVDYPALKKHIDWLIAEGTQGIVPCGTTGESATFSHEEQHKVIAETVQHVRGRAFVIAGAGSNSTREAVSLAQAAERMGADGILTITPYYNKPNQEGIFQHFRAVREACRLPMVLYNVPGRTGTNMLPETAARVAALGGVDSIKDAAANLDQTWEQIRLGVGVLSGDDGMTFPMMALGARGVISVVANFAPRLVRQLCDACAAGDLAAARRHHGVIVELAKHAFADVNPIPAKSAVSALGFCAEAYRLPLVPPQPEKKAAMLACLRKHGLLPA
jgi:4-hydroxy-tetrahydrodipicolinate synthase